MKKLLAAFLLILLLGVTGLSVIKTPSASAAFNPNNIMSDSVFNDTGSMSLNDIKNFLNSFGSSCISPNSGFTAPNPTG